MVLAKIPSELQRSRVPFLFLQWKAFVPTHWRINGSSSWTCLWLSMLICNYARSYYVIGYVLISNKAAPLRQGWCKRKQVQLCLAQICALECRPLWPAGWWCFFSWSLLRRILAFGVAKYLIVIFWNDVSSKSWRNEAHPAGHVPHGSRVSRCRCTGLRGPCADCSCSTAMAFAHSGGTWWLPRAQSKAGKAELTKNSKYDKIW